MTDTIAEENIFDHLEAMLGMLLKREAVHDYFDAHEVRCPHCDQGLTAAGVLKSTKDITANSPPRSRSESSEEIVEARELLKEIQSWSEQEINQLPKRYQDKVQYFRKLTTN